MKTEEMFAGFSVAAGEDRFGEHIKLGGEPNDCKVSAKDTDGAMCVFEFTGSGGGPRHLHHDQDEWIYVIEGEFDFEVGDERFRLGAGETVFIPRKIAHVWALRERQAGQDHQRVPTRRQDGGVLPRGEQRRPGPADEGGRDQQHVYRAARDPAAPTVQHPRHGPARPAELCPE